MQTKDNHQIGNELINLWLIHNITDLDVLKP